MPPCTMPKRSWPGAAGLALHRSAQRVVRSTAAASTGSGASGLGTSSRHIAMSEPSVAWIRMASSGRSRTRSPS